MKALIQRVTYASVTISDSVYSSIDSGLLVLLGVDQNDTKGSANTLVNKIIHYRLFDDQNGKMNLNVMEIEGEILIIPQFTLVSNTNKGLRPSFSSAATPSVGKMMFDHSVIHAKSVYNKIKTGSFGANMQITSCNDGPVSFILEN